MLTLHKGDGMSKESTVHGNRAQERSQGKKKDHTLMDSEAFRRKVNIEGFAMQRKKEKP